MMLRERWMELCRRNDQAGALAEWDCLVEQYGQTWRAYHTLKHIASCLEVFDRLSMPVADRDSVEFALWYHDVVYDPRRSDNERASAETAARFLRAPADLEKIQKLIMATQHTELPADDDAKLICDIDLSILGANRQQYEDYTRGIRAEYAWVEEQDYARKRARLLQRFLDRPAIFLTEAYREALEARARDNLRREIAALARRATEAADRRG